MSSKRAKLTADKARERITSLEESILSREQKLEQLRVRISRASSPDAKLLAAQERLERRLELEQEQIQKLRRLLSQRSEESGQEGAEFLNSEEIDDLHRSFEEVKQDLSHMKLRLENADLPRDLPGRLTSFEERISRREEVASDLYAQILGLQNALDQERQTVRKLSRRIREQDQNLDALREAVEDSVVATVDLAERLEEMEESLSEEVVDSSIEAASLDELRPALQEQMTQLQEKLQAIESKLEKVEQESASSDSSELEIVMDALNDFDSRLENLETRLLAGLKRAEAPEPAAEGPDDSPLMVVSPKEGSRAGWVPARFKSGGSRGSLTARWEPADFECDQAPATEPK